MKNTHIQFNKQEAFTMAEVLITLAIIGIVAALTIPQVLAKHKKAVVETELKKAFSVLNQAIARSEVDNESAAYWEWAAVSGREGKERFFDKYFRPYLSIRGNYSSNLSQGKARFIPISGAGESLAWYYNNSNNPMFVILSDGSVVRFQTADGRGGQVGSWQVILPHSASKKRIMFGRDAFSFAINLNKNKASVSVFPNSYLGWNCQIVEQNRADFISKCYELGSNTSGIYPDTYCTILIYCNNWKIPDDYPIHF